MSLLTSQQALADAALFIQWLKYNNSGATNLDNAKVVTFGGSYPGNLAAWMRQNYPNIVNLAVASSAPVEAKLEFPEFLRTVSEVIYQQDPTCFRKIYGAFRCMDNLVNDLQCNETEAWSVYASPQELLDGLHQCRPYNFSVNFERQQFFHNLGARWGSNFPGHRSTSKCHTLVLQNNLDVIEDYGNFLVQTGQTRETCQRSEKDLSAALRTPHAEKTRFDEDPEDEIVEFVKSLSGRDGKSWTWQTCYEFGYFQVADPEIQLFSDEWDSLIDIRRCQSIFPDANFTRKSIQSRIDLTNAFYKGKKFEGSCTIFVNGQWDPWHSLGFNQQNETTSRNTVISIPQAEHCEDMKSHPNPSVFMYQAQQRIREQIGKYLMDPNC
ncbi:putative serine protease K12H4.7 isoform X2 [Folsomia candida]|nr:putative serine protease K12H4.7 isoform X2 [Folsomia candida]